MELSAESNQGEYALYSVDVGSHGKTYVTYYRLLASKSDGGDSTKMTTREIVMTSEVWVLLDLDL